MHEVSGFFQLGIFRFSYERKEEEKTKTAGQTDGSVSFTAGQFARCPDLNEPPDTYIHYLLHTYTLLHLPLDFRVAYVANISKHLTIRCKIYHHAANYIPCSFDYNSTCSYFYYNNMYSLHYKQFKKLEFMRTSWKLDIQELGHGCG